MTEFGNGDRDYSKKSGDEAHGSSKVVSRLPALAEKWSDPTLQAVFADTVNRGGSVLNLHIATGHAPNVAKARRALAHALRNKTITPRHFRELAILRVAQLLDSEYEWNQHVDLAIAAGLTQNQIDGLKNWTGGDQFSDEQRSLLKYADEVSAGGSVQEDTFTNLAGNFTPQEIVELTVTITHYYANCLLTKSLRIEVETDGRRAAPGELK
jgi:alkylhydroperoxidase family enzyme